MEIPKDVYKRIIKKHGAVLDLKSDPRILEDILNELRSIEQQDYAQHQQKTSGPFNVSWMDSWAANWMLHNQPQASPEKDFSAVMKQLVDMRFRERLQDIKHFIGGRQAEPPDGGSPEPGTGGGGPHSIFVPTPLPPDTFMSPPPPDPNDPDNTFFGGGGVFEPPDGGPPEPGVPDPPDPGPDPGPDSGVLRDNPWILYWFVSINAPMILEMIDAHFTKRLTDLRMQIGKK